MFCVNLAGVARLGLRLSAQSRGPANSIKLDEHNTSRDVYSDRGFPSAQRSQTLKVLCYREHIQRKAKAGQGLSEWKKVA